MFATRPLRMEWEIIRWIVLLVLATALALVAVRAAAGAEITLPGEPGRGTSLHYSGSPPSIASKGRAGV